MKTILKLISNWQGFAALLAAAAIFYFSPTMLRWLDPTAGVFDTGYLQRPIVAASYFFFATFWTETDSAMNGDWLAINSSWRLSSPLWPF
jgi:Na+-driven multidrug efflux pump